MNKEDLLKKHFRQSLSEEEEKEFKLLLESDNDFKALYEEYLNFNLAFKSHEAEELKAFLASVDEQEDVKKITWYKSSTFYYLVAAVLIIALCLPFLLKPSASSLYNDFYEVYPNVEQPVVRGSQETNSYNAFKAYEASNYGLATKAFEELLQTESNPNYKFYFAMSLLNDGKFDQALNALTDLEDLKFNYTDETLWYMSLILIKQGQPLKAIPKLELLDKSNSSFKSEKRKVLLQKLKDD